MPQSGGDLDGHKDVLDMWAGDGDGESVKFWFGMLSERRNHSVNDVFFVVCGGLEGLPARVITAYPHPLVQICIIHLTRSTFCFASRNAGTR